MALKAIFLERVGDLGVERQMAVCLRWAEIHNWDIVSVVHQEADAVALIRLGFAVAVIVALMGPDDEHFQALVADAGGRLEYCRRLREALEQDTGALVVAMARRGKTPDQIAGFLGIALAKVRRFLRT